MDERPDSPRRELGTAPLPPQTLRSARWSCRSRHPGRPGAAAGALARGDALTVSIDLPALASAPRGMIYVPAGRFLFGSEDRSDARRGFLSAAPLHECRPPRTTSAATR